MKQGHIFGDLWDGWISFVRELVGQTPDAPNQRNKKSEKKIEKAMKVVTTQKPHPQPQPQPQKPLKQEEKELIGAVDPPKPFQLDENYLETPKERLARLERQQTKKKRTDFRSKKHRQLLFMNPGTTALDNCHKAFKLGLDLPEWAKPFEQQLSFNDKRLFFEQKPMLTKEEKVKLVKTEYFDPKGFSTIIPIYDKFKKEYANMTRGDVSRALRSFETYQLNFRRRHPPKVLSRMNLKKPGVILLDTFFPSKKDGWREDLAGAVTCMDAWSRYVRAYAVERKTKKIVTRAIEKFLREFASMGHLPRIILCDKGSELKGAYEAIEKYRTKPGKLVFHSTTGKPVNLVEQTQAQIQRRMAVFRTSGITDDFSAILDDICDSINSQKRPGRGDLTPIQLLALDKAGRDRVNMNSRFGAPTPELNGLRPLFVGSHVRVLMMTIKEQVTNKTKGFQEKWSRDVYRVKRKTALQGNPNHYRYFLHGDSESYFRHELLWVPSVTDTSVIDSVTHQENVLGEDIDFSCPPPKSPLFFIYLFYVLKFSKIF